MNLFEKAAEFGIQTEFIDAEGHRRMTDAAALQVVLDALATQPRRLLKSAVVARAGHQAAAELGEATAFPVKWEIRSGDKTVASGAAVSRSVQWPADLPAGSYRLHLTDASSVSEETPFLVAPAKAFAGDFDRTWLLAVQLYSLKSARNWGIGDFTDLERLIELAANLGAGGVGLNPLHVLFDDRPRDCSPYSPNSRLFINPLYIDVEQLPEFSGKSTGAGDAILRLKQQDTIDYAGVAELKWSALRDVFTAFKADAKPERQAGFKKFRDERGGLLSRFACFEFLRHQQDGPWWEWPEQWRQPDDAKCRKLRDGADADRIEFIEFVQWCADDQLKRCQDLALKLRMKVGLYLDVAVGVQADGFDAWNEQVAISRHLAVGAPPDILNTAGQNWGLAGFNAAGLATRLFEPFRQMVRASMRHAGAIRLDHVLGLMRLYLIPSGFGADQGVYAEMPFQALLAVTAQESAANRCVVIGEDLGTVPEGFRDQMADWGIWSYLVMMFERDYHNGTFNGIDRYMVNALVTFNTHDLSTFAGWKGSDDLVLKRSLGIDPGESDDSRRHALHMLSDVLRHNGIERGDFYGAVKFLARTKSRLLAVSLEDLLGVIDQPNIPGTVDEHPNWRRRLPVAMEDMTSAIDVAALRDATRERS
jgi:4-alpha-glucanotransferase